MNSSPGAMEAHLGAMEAHPGAMEACPGAITINLEQWRLALKLWRLNLEAWRLTLYDLVSMEAHNSNRCPKDCKVSFSVVRVSLQGSRGTSKASE
jgi:hypothetical protein